MESDIRVGQTKLLLCTEHKNCPWNKNLVTVVQIMADGQCRISYKGAAGYAKLADLHDTFRDACEKALESCE